MKDYKTLVSRRITLCFIAYLLACLFVYLFVRSFVLVGIFDIFVCTFAFVSLYACLFVCLKVCVFVCLFVCLLVCLHVFMFLSLYVCLFFVCFLVHNRFVCLHHMWLYVMLEMPLSISLNISVCHSFLLVSKSFAGSYKHVFKDLEHDSWRGQTVWCAGKIGKTI